MARDRDVARRHVRATGERMAYDDKNVFARILRGELPAHTVYEDEHCIAFMDLMPQVDGHTLVIPRAPAVDLFDIEPDSLANVVRATQRVARGVQKAFDASGVMIAQLSGAAAGQTVFHLHFHILPRNHGVEFKLHARDVADAAVLAEHAQRVRAALATMTSTR
jgi:histidine triad (HIT) family protein